MTKTSAEWTFLLQREKPISFYHWPIETTHQVFPPHSHGQLIDMKTHSYQKNLIEAESIDIGDYYSQILQHFTISSMYYGSQFIQKEQHLWSLKNLGFMSRVELSLKKHGGKLHNRVPQLIYRATKLKPQKIS